MSSIPGEIVVLPVAGGRWIVMNVHCRTCLGVESSGLELLQREGAVEPSGQTSLHRLWNIERAVNATGLFSDPTPFPSRLDAWPDVEFVSDEELVEQFKRHFLLVDDMEAYRDRLAVRDSLLDRRHIGNFHQRLGAELLLKRRQSPVDWWLNQKFADDGEMLGNNLYRAVQASCLEGYLQGRLKRGDHLLDVGCGTGAYTRYAARLTGSALGVDPNSDFIERARGHSAGSGASFTCMDIPQGLEVIEDESADFVLMCDAMLFYFVSADGSSPPDVGRLFREVRRILKPGGAFISVEPHEIFWLLPWLGDDAHPFTIVSEHARRWYGVTPTGPQVVQAAARSRLFVSWMEELLLADNPTELADGKAIGFAREFPLWKLIEFVPGEFNRRHPACQAEVL